MGKQFILIEKYSLSNWKNNSQSPIRNALIENSLFKIKKTLNYILYLPHNTIKYSYIHILRYGLGYEELIKNEEPITHALPWNSHQSISSSYSTITFKFFVPLGVILYFTTPHIVARFIIFII